MKKTTLTALAAACLLLTACHSDPESESAGTQAENTEEVAPPGHQQMTRTTQSAHSALSKKPHFDISAQSYGEQINQQLQGSEFADKTLTDLSESDSDKVFITDYTHHISVVGEVNEDDQLEDLTYTMPVNDSIETEAAALIQLTAASMHVLNPEVSAEQATDKVTGLINQVITAFKETNEQQQEVSVIGDKVYVAQISDRGLRFLIEPTEDSRFVQ